MNTARRARSSLLPDAKNISSSSLGSVGLSRRRTLGRQRAIGAIDDNAWVDIDYTAGGRAQVAETIYTVGEGTKTRSVRLIVRRTRLTNNPQRRLWPDWRHHAFITNRADLDTIKADQFHRQHAVVELAIRDLKEGAGLEHIPSGHYPANCAWLACAVLAHNLGTWTSLLADQPPVTNRTRRTQLIALPAVFVNRSSKPTLRFPARWPFCGESDFVSLIPVCISPHGRVLVCA